LVLFFKKEHLAFPSQRIDTHNPARVNRSHHMQNLRPGPLGGAVVLDLSRILAGPYCTLLLHELGARIIKVEPPQGDDSRAYGPFQDGESLYFAAINRGKESIALDLKQAGDRAIFDRLLSRADVLVENFRPGTMEKLGLGWESLHARHPRLIYAAASGFGHTGPDSKKPAYDMIVQGLGGIMSVTGHPGQKPARIGVSIGDLGAGIYTALGIASALYHRERTGEAVKVDVSMLDCQLSLMENPAMRYLATGIVPGPMGGRHATITPFAIFETADKPVVIAAGNDVLFKKLCAALGKPEWAADPRFATNDTRRHLAEELAAMIEQVLAAHGADHWLALLEEAGIPAGPINRIAEALAHPQVGPRNMIVEAGGIRMIGNPVKIIPFAANDDAQRPPAPRLDGDRTRLLAEFSASPCKSE
jgi:CoA:oxalate CoA-transferase